MMITRTSAATTDQATGEGSIVIATGSCATAIPADNAIIAAQQNSQIPGLLIDLANSARSISVGRRRIRKRRYI